MGFFTWLVVIIIAAFVLCSAFSWFLNWLYPEVNELPEEFEDETTIGQRLRTQRKWIGIFVLVATIIITAMTGINAFLAQT